MSLTVRPSVRILGEGAVTLRFVLRSASAVALMLGAILSASPIRASEPGDVAGAFGASLVRQDAPGLRKVFPSEGKIRLSLRVLGPEDGLYGPGQAEAIFRELLTKTAVRSFDVSRVESDGRTGGLAILRLAVTDRDGHDRRVGLRLTLEPERGTWVVREVREAPE